MSDKFQSLVGQQYMNLTTYRKTGVAMVTPVWFALDSDKGRERIVMITAPIAGKLKRIRNNPKVEVGPSNGRGKPLGPTITARARILSEAEGKVAEELLNRKYGFVKKLWNLFIIRGKPMNYIEIR